MKKCKNSEYLIATCYVILGILFVLMPIYYFEIMLYHIVSGLPCGFLLFCVLSIFLAPILFVWILERVVQ